jgi:hypothetical protein
LAGRVVPLQNRGERGFINKITMLEGFLKIPRRLLAGEGKRRGGCGIFCNRRDAWVRVPLTPSPRNKLLQAARNPGEADSWQRLKTVAGRNQKP